MWFTMDDPKGNQRSSENGQIAMDRGNTNIDSDVYCW